jgi:hypothetical protein
MAKFSLHLSRLIHENLSVVMCFVYSRRPLQKLIQENFVGEWKYLNNALFDISEQRVEKACFELAIFLRLWDDKENITNYIASRGEAFSCGRLLKKDGLQDDLPFREVANKIIHASHLQWDIPESGPPLLICEGSEDERWIRAEIDIVRLATFCGNIMSY